MCKGIFLAVGLGLLPGIAAAQQGLACDTPLRLRGVEAEAVPDRVHELVAYPGAFGGDVSCVLEKRGEVVEQYWVEFLPDTAATREHVTYKTGAIAYYLKFLEEEAAAREVAACTLRGEGGLACRVDLAAGKGLYLMRFFAPDLSFSGIRVMAFPGNGVVNDTLWDMVGKDVEAGRMTMEMDLKLPQMEWSQPLAEQDESSPGRLVWGVSGDPAGAFMQEIYTRKQPVVLETRVTNVIGTQEVTTTATHDVTEGNLTYLIDKLAKVEQLMVAGFEESREIRF